MFSLDKYFSYFSMKTCFGNSILVIRNASKGYFCLVDIHVHLMCRFLTLPGTRATWRQRWLLCTNVYMYLYSLAFMDHPCTRGATVYHQAPPCPLYTQPRACWVWARCTNGLKIVWTRVGFEPTISRTGFALGFFFLSPPFSPIWFFLCHFL